MRKPIGFQPYPGRVTLCGRDDEASVLSAAGRWLVGSHMAADFAQEIAELEWRGLITERGRYYNLTPAGYNRLAAIGWGLMHDEALENQSHAQASPR